MTQFTSRKRWCSPASGFNQRSCKDNYDKLENEDVWGYRRLIQSIVVKAVEEADETYFTEYYNNKFSYHCNLLGWNPEYVREKALKLISKKGLKRNLHSVMKQLQKEQQEVIDNSLHDRYLML